MKSRVMSIAICLLMIVCVSASITQNAKQLSSSGIIYVDDDNTSGIEDGSIMYPYNTIKEGVNAAISGDDVYVFAGTYNENVNITTTLSIQGEDKNTTIIHGWGGGDVITISADWVNLSCFTVRNGSRGIYISSDYVVISHVIITSIRGADNSLYFPGGSAWGIHLQSSSHSHISNTIIGGVQGGDGGLGILPTPAGKGGDATGIYLSDSNNNKLGSNNITDLTGGTGGGGSKIDGAIGGNAVGIHLESSNDNNLTSNLISATEGGEGGNGGQYYPGGAGGTSKGISLINSADNNLDSNAISNLKGGTGGRGGYLGNGGPGGNIAGIHIEESNHNTLICNALSALLGGHGGMGYAGPLKFGFGGVGGSSVGISLSNAAFNDLIENMISNLDGGGGGQGNRRQGEGGFCIGIRISDSSDNYISSNAISDLLGGSAGFGGYETKGSDGGFTYGIHMPSSTNNIVESNTISNLTGGTARDGHERMGGTGGASAGVWLSSSDNNILRKNSILNLDGGTGGKGGDQRWGGYGGSTAGIHLVSSDNNAISANGISILTGGGGGTGGTKGNGGQGGTTSGIYISGSSYNDLTSNVITDLLGGTGGLGVIRIGGAGGISAGVQIMGSEYIALARNTIVNITGGTGGRGSYVGNGGNGGFCAGIYLSDSTNNTLNSSMISHSAGGIGGAGGSSGSPGASDMGIGILLLTCVDNCITNTTLSDNEYGARFISSSRNRVFHNNFINNTNQAYDGNPLLDDWHHTSLLEGNYWSDYTGVDDGSGSGKHAIAGDGIGDTLIPHPTTDYDFYPFMNENGWFNRPPMADAGGPYTDYEGSSIMLDASASFDSDGDPFQYRWDFENNGIWNTGWSTSPYVNHTWSDDYIGAVLLEVTDGQFTNTDTCNVTVQNVDPTVAIESITIEVEIGLRVAGRKYNNVSMALYENGSLLGYVSIERLPGSPDEQIAWVPVNINFSKSYNATVTYTPEDPPNVGGNPVWIYLKSKNGSIKKIHHTFNVQQSKKRDSEHWNHVEPWEVDLNGYFIGLPFEITPHITDPGSDDETLIFTYGSQVKTVIYLNNPPNPDPYPSPEINPVDIMDTTTLVYEGPGIVILVVKDDDNIRLGVGEGTDVKSVG